MRMAGFIKVSAMIAVIAGGAFAQDVITMRDGSEVQAFVVEVGDDAVKYKKWHYQDGPFFIASVSKVFSIRYRNGEKQVFEIKENPFASTPQPPLYVPFYVPQYTEPAPAALPRLPLKPDVSDDNAGKSKRVWGRVLLWSGIAELYTGIGLTAEVGPGFVSMIISGGASLAIGIPLLVSGKRERRQYESGYGALMPDRLQISPQKVEFVWAF